MPVSLIRWLKSGLRMSRLEAVERTTLIWRKTTKVYPYVAFHHMFTILFHTAGACYHPVHTVDGRCRTFRAVKVVTNHFLPQVLVTDHSVAQILVADHPYSIDILFTVRAVSIRALPFRKACTYYRNCTKKTKNNALKQTFPSFRSSSKYQHNSIFFVFSSVSCVLSLD